jgi:hypothetical protein
MEMDTCLSQLTVHAAYRDDKFVNKYTKQTTDDHPDKA